MYGNTLTRSLNAFSHMLRYPSTGARWWRNRVTRQSAVDQRLPWNSYRSIDFLRAQVRPGWRVFEWGGGGSTLFYLDRGCRVTTVESSDTWIQCVRQAAQGQAERLELRFIPAETGEPAAVQAYLQAVHEGAPWDLVLIDGLERETPSRAQCAAEARGLVRSGGLIVLDDAWRQIYQEVPRLLAGYERHEFWGLGPARWGVTKTDVYRAV